MEEITKWLHAPSFKFSWRRGIKSCIDWDGDMVLIGRNEYWMYHFKVSELTWVDWFHCLKYQLFGNGFVHRVPVQ